MLQLDKKKNNLQKLINLIKTNRSDFNQIES